MSADPENDAPRLTSGGIELTDDLVERLAAEAEQGYDVSLLRPRPRAGQSPDPDPDEIVE